MKNQIVKVDNANYVTTKELASVLNVSVRTINETIQKLNKDLASTFQVKVKNGVATKLNEKQATLIKNEIKKHHNLTNRQIDFVSTTIEEDAIVMKAMSILNNRISKQQKKIESLQIELDQSKEWYSIKRMEMLNPEKSFNWRLLKKKSDELGFERKSVFDANYGEVKAYHKKVWEELFFDTLNYE